MAMADRRGAMDASMRVRATVTVVGRTSGAPLAPGQFHKGRFSGTGKMASPSFTAFISLGVTLPLGTRACGMLLQVWHTQKGMLVYEGQYKDRAVWVITLQCLQGIFQCKLFEQLTASSPFFSVASGIIYIYYIIYPKN